MKITGMLLGLFVLSSVACANQSGDLSAEVQYRAFQQALKDESRDVAYEDYLSSSLMAVINDAGSSEEKAQLKAQSAFPLWLNIEMSMLEKVTDSGRCLTVAGEARDSTPAMVVVAFLQEQKILKADQIHYQYLESENDLPSEALCPHELQVDFP